MHWKHVGITEHFKHIQGKIFMWKPVFLKVWIVMQTI